MRFVEKENLLKSLNTSFISNALPPDNALHSLQRGFGQPSASGARRRKMAYKRNALFGGLASCRRADFR